MSTSNVMPIVSNEQVINEEVINEQQWNYNDPNHKPPFCTDYTEMHLNNDLDDEILRIMVGKDGCNFKKITENNKMAYIFHNKERNKIEIWGNKNKFTKVIKQINNHLDYATRVINTRTNESTQK